MEYEVLQNIIEGEIIFAVDKVNYDVLQYEIEEVFYKKVGYPWHIVQQTRLLHNYVERHDRSIPRGIPSLPYGEHRSSCKKTIRLIKTHKLRDYFSTREEAVEALSKHSEYSRKEFQRKSTNQNIQKKLLKKRVVCF